MRAAGRWRCWRRPCQGPKTKRVARVTEVSTEARREGVRAGMTGAQASAVCAGLRLLTVTAADREAAAAALADVGYAFAPRIERGGNGIVFERIFFDSEDLARLYPAGETAIAQAVQAAAARVGLGARVAIAASKGVARLATRAHELALVPTAAGPARAALASIPVELAGGRRGARARRSGAGGCAPRATSRRCRSMRSGCGSGPPARALPAGARHWTTSRSCRSCPPTRWRRRSSSTIQSPSWSRCRSCCAAWSIGRSPACAGAASPAPG